MTRVILTFGLKFTIPLSKVDENLERAYGRDAVHEQKFYFRKDILTGNNKNNHLFYKGCLTII